jgi:crotonobetainyl-CoA:carnitine CoA-transferase CaiB-like acyl-CoA transferase
MVKCLHAAKTQRGSSFYHIPQSGLALRVVWPAQDGHIYIMLHDGELGERENPVLVRWLDDAGIADDFIRTHDWHGFHWRDQTQEVIDRIHGYFERLFRSLTMAAIMGEAARRGIVLQAFNRPSDVLAHPQLDARGYWTSVEHPELGTSLRYPGRFCLPSRSDCQLRFPAPGIGEHNREIYCTEMRIPLEEYMTLQSRRVV